MQKNDRGGLIFVTAAVSLFSTSPVFTAWADPLSPFVKTGGRLLVAAIALGAVLLIRRATGGKERHAAGLPFAAEPGGEIAPIEDAPRQRQHSRAAERACVSRSTA